MWPTTVQWTSDWFLSGISAQTAATILSGKHARVSASVSDCHTHNSSQNHFDFRNFPQNFIETILAKSLDKSRLLLLDRDRQAGVIRGASSPPPTYRSHAGTLLRYAVYATINKTYFLKHRFVRFVPNI